jgi:hypothetical protein
MPSSYSLNHTKNGNRKRKRNPTHQPLSPVTTSRERIPQALLLTLEDPFIEGRRQGACDISASFMSYPTTLNTVLSCPVPSLEEQKRKESEQKGQLENSNRTERYHTIISQPIAIKLATASPNRRIAGTGEIILDLRMYYTTVQDNSDCEKRGCELHFEEF